MSRSCPLLSDGQRSAALAPKMLALKASFPIVTLTGPRQSGKTTLCRSTFPHFAYFNLEAPQTRRAAERGPRPFLEAARRANFTNS